MMQENKVKKFLMAGIDPGFVDIEPTTIIFENFKRQ